MIAVTTVSVPNLQGRINPPTTTEQSFAANLTPSKTAFMTLVAAKIANSEFRHAFAAVESNPSEEGGHESYVVRLH